MILKTLFDEIDAIRKRDPAAQSRLGVIFLYPSFSCFNFL